MAAFGTKLVLFGGIAVLIWAVGLGLARDLGYWQKHPASVYPAAAPTTKPAPLVKVMVENPKPKAVSLVYDGKQQDVSAKTTIFVGMEIKSGAQGEQFVEYTLDGETVKRPVTPIGK